MIFLTALNYINHSTHDLVIDLFLSLIVLVSFIVIFRFDIDKTVYRIALFIWSLAILYAVGIGSGYGSTLYWILIVPGVLFFFFEKKEGSLWASIFFFGSVILVCYPSLLGTYSYDFYHRVGSIASFMLITGLAYGIESNRSRYSHLLKEQRDVVAVEKENLQNALNEIRTLSGMLPICAHCKKIRNDKGYWQQVETYILEHSEAEFSHGICPDCADRFYKDRDGVIRDGEE